MVICDAILLGAGLGTRFAETTPSSSKNLPKQFHELDGLPVFIHSIRSMASLGIFRQYIVVVPATYVGVTRELLLKHIVVIGNVPVKVIPGGTRRQDSSRIAMEHLEQEANPPTRVVIHDACRPFISNDFLKRIADKVQDRSYGAWIPVIPVVDTLKRIENLQVIETVDRSLVHRVQTPQVFEFSVIRSLGEKTKEAPDLNFTDDAALCEYYGIPVGVFDGDVRNIKLTYDFEMEMLRLVMKESKDRTESPSRQPEIQR